MAAESTGKVPEVTMEESDLYKAIKENQTDRVIKLLEEDKNDLRLRNENGDTFLHVVVKQSGSLDIFKALVGKLSDTSLLLRNEASQTAYDLIISGDYPREAADVLRDDVWRWVSEGGWTRAEQVASSGWDVWSLNTQQTQGTGDLQEKIGKFQSEVEAFHKSVMEGNVEEVKKVLEADNESLLTAADKTGTYPLQKAIIFQQNTVLNLLLESKYKSQILNLSDNMMRTAAHYAGGSHDGGHVYSILKEGGADLNIKDLRGKTPEDYFNRPEDLSVVEVQRRLRDLLYPDNDASQSDQQQIQLQQEDNTQQQQQLNNTETTETDSTTRSVEQKENLINSKPPTPSTPPGRKPVQMYISSDIYEKKNVPPPVTVDGRYIARHLGSALTSALAEIAESRPWDPIEYLAHWLLKYRKNLDYNKSQEDMLKNIRSEEAAMDEEETQRAKRLEEERQIREEEERKRQEEEEEERQRKEEEELQRKAKEVALLQKPLLQTVSEELEEDNLYKERDERGQTELHKLAAQEGADLVALFNLGYSLADRDINNQTPRDIAEDNDIQENLDAMDSYITNMIEQEKLDALQQLLLDGYDKLDAVLSQVSTDGLPEEVTDFLKAVPEFQVKIQEALKAVESGVLREVEQCLDRKKFALAKDKYGRSPLHIAVLIENREIVEYIVKHFPVTVKCRDNLNRTPLHYASALSENIADVLKSVPGVDEQAKDVKDRTPVYYSTEKTEIQQIQNQFRMSKAETDNSDQTETETDQNDQQKTEPEQVTSATD